MWREAIMITRDILYGLVPKLRDEKRKRLLLINTQCTLERGSLYNQWGGSR